MEGIAKTAPQPVTNTPIKHQDATLTHNEQPTVHPEIYKYFNINPLEGGDYDKMIAINQWAFDEASSTGKALQKIKKLELQLGSPSTGETRVSKLSNWIRIQSHIKETQNSMKSELEKTQAQYKHQVKQMKEQRSPELQKLEDEIDKIKVSLKNAIQQARIHVTNRTKKIKQEYQSKLKELEEMKKAYKK